MASFHHLFCHMSLWLAFIASLLLKQFQKDEGGMNIDSSGKPMMLYHHYFGS